MIIMIIILSFLAGSFTTSFKLNLCYSELISNIRKDNSRDINLDIKIQSLPLSGYETNCNKVLEQYKQQK